MKSEIVRASTELQRVDPDQLPGFRFPDIPEEWREGFVIAHVSRFSPNAEAPVVRLIVDGEVVPPSENVVNIVETTVTFLPDPPQSGNDGSIRITYIDFRSTMWKLYGQPIEQYFPCSKIDVRKIGLCRLILARPIGFNQHGPVSVERIEQPPVPLRLDDGE